MNLARSRKRCLVASAEIGGVALLINAKNEKVARWYASDEARNCPHPGSVFLEFLIRKFDEVRPVRRGCMTILVLAEGNVP